MSSSASKERHWPPPASAEPDAGLPNRIPPISKIWARRCATPLTLAGRPNRPRHRDHGGKHSWTIGTSPDSRTAGAPHRADRRRARNRHCSGAGLSRRGLPGVGRTARRRGQFRHPHAPAAKHRRVRADFGALQAVLRRRSGSALLAARVLAQGEPAAHRRRRFRGLWRLGRA